MHCVDAEAEERHRCSMTGRELHSKAEATWLDSGPAAQSATVVHGIHHVHLYSMEMGRGYAIGSIGSMGQSGGFSNDAIHSKDVEDDATAGRCTVHAYAPVVRRLGSQLG